MLSLKKYTDNDLINIIAGKPRKREKAFTELYFRYENRLYNHLRHLCCSKEIADDIFQQTWQNFYNKVVGNYIVENIRAYLFTIANNLYRNHIRDNKKNISIDNIENDSIFEEFTTIKSFEGKIEQDEISALVRGALELLDEKIRTVVILKKFEDMTYREISEIVNISAEGVKKRYSKGLKELHTILKPYLQDYV